MTAPGVLTLRVPIQTKSEANMRGHWRPRWKRTREQRHLTKHMLLPKVAWGGMREWPAFVVTLTRIAPSSGLDDDNLRGALKAIRDGVADALGIDDGNPRIRWDYRQERGAYAVLVQIAKAAQNQTAIRGTKGGSACER